MEELKSKRSIQAFLKKLPLEFIVIGSLFLVSLLLFAFIAHAVVFQKKDLFDSKAIHFISGYSSEIFIDTMKVFTFFGSGTFLIPAYIFLIILLLVKRKMIQSIHIAIIAITSTALSHYAKRIFQRARPELPLIQSLKTYSFPSGHALSSFIFCSILIYLVWNSKIRLIWKWVFSVFLFLFAMTIGLSRIMLGMHYPSDVLAGFCLGLVWVIVSFYLMDRIESTRRFPKNFSEKGSKMPKAG